MTSSAASETDDFFRSRAFYDAEGVTHTLRVGSDEAPIALPLLVRDLADAGLVDAASPYGYPGGAVGERQGAPPDPAAIDWSGTALVSVFVRDRGAGFDRTRVKKTRRGLVESIEGRMERVGGSSSIVSSPGNGTEVELRVPRSAT